MKADILQFLTVEVLSGQLNDLSASDDLLSTELIDSMGVMRLVAFIEEKSGKKIPPEDVTIENFLSVDSICAYLDRRDAEQRSEQT